MLVLRIPSADTTPKEIDQIGLNCVAVLNEFLEYAHETHDMLTFRTSRSNEADDEIVVETAGLILLCGVGSDDWAVFFQGHDSGKIGYAIFDMASGNTYMLSASDLLEQYGAVSVIGMAGIIEPLLNRLKARTS